MNTPRPRFRFGLHAKVLIAVLCFLVALPAATLWIVSQRMRQQMDSEALRTLNYAETFFVRLLESRGGNLVARYQSLANEARFRVKEVVEDPGSIGISLKDVHDVAPQDHDAFLYLNGAGEIVASVVRTSDLDPVKVAAQSDRGTAANFKNTAVGGKGYTVVSVPALELNSSQRLGTLVVAVRISDVTMSDLGIPDSTAAILFSEGHVVASTMQSDLPSIRPAEGDVPGEPLSVVLDGHHYKARSGTLARGGLRYVILSSYQERLGALEETLRTLGELSIGGIVLSALVVSFFVRRLTQPLRELSATAEAVGRGDFSRRVEQTSNDECGDLAVAFNQMTANLEGSRGELQRTVDTLKATQTQLIQSEKLSAVGQFVAGVAHELNNPLTAVIGFSDLLCQTATDPEIRPHLNLIAKSAHRCHKIVHSLLSFARQHPPERRLVRVHDSIDEVLEIMAYDLRTSNISVERDYQQDLPQILADPHQLQQVFVNILSNARQAIQPVRTEGRIVVRTRAVGPVIRIEFVDNGPGIQAEHLSRIFDPFFTTKPVGKGTGLGMSLSYGIVNEHGGKISVQSELGNGAAFTIDLPVAVDGHQIIAPPAPMLRNSRSPIPAGKTVLVVDDEEWILFLSQALLEQDGFVVEIALSGEKAIEHLRNRQFDVIVSDWKMPGLNGIQLYEHLCATNLVAASRMIFMTGDVISDTFQEFLRRHSRICLSKPFAIGDFRNAVANMAAEATA